MGGWNWNLIVMFIIIIVVSYVVYTWVPMYMLYHH